jgi:hypothetical protein
VPSILKAKSLATFKNQLDLPEGSLLVADNIVIDKDNIIMPRRGFSVYGTTTPCTTQIKNLITYKERVLRHYGTKLQYDCCCNAGTFATFAGCYTEPEVGIRIKYVESNSNLYFTTSDGIKKIGGTLDSCCNTNFTTAASFITDAGGPKALDITATLSISCGAFLSGLSKTAYRFVWGRKDVNNNLILGAPSNRLVVTNTSCSQANVCLNTSIPSDVIACDFLQIYRTGVETAPCCCIANICCAEPGDEMNLIIEKIMTAADITAGTYCVQDTVPDSFRVSGVLLYTNPTSGEGILQANDKPPIAKDVALFRNSVFYANTSTVQRRQFNILSVSGLTSGNSKVIVGNCTGFKEYTFRGATEVATMTAVADVAGSLIGKYFLGSSASNERNYAFYYINACCTCAPCACDTSGRILVPITIANCDTAASVACKSQTVINGEFDFTATVCCAVVTITNAKNGNTTDWANGATSPGFTFCTTTQGDGECVCARDVLLSSLVSAGQSIDESARSLVNIMNRDTTGLVDAFYLSGEDDLPGIILLESKNLSDGAFYVGVRDDCACISCQFSPAMPDSKAVTSFAAACSCTKTLVTMGAAHGYSNCCSIYIYNTTNCTCNAYTISSVVCCACCCTFTFKVTGTLTETCARVYKANVNSDNEVSPNRLYFSKPCQPEAVPLLNFIDIGGRDEAIERIVALRDNIFALKEDGVYIITGCVAPAFTDRLLDCAAIILAPDSATTLNNQIYMLSTQGIATVSDTGVGVVSRNIEDKILDVTGDGFCFRTASFGISSESDRAYHVWLPTTTCDTTATQVYRYNVFNQSWVRWTITAEAGVVNPRDDKIYLAKTAKVHKERKSNDRTDYADEEFSLTLPVQTIAACSNLLTVSSTACMTVGDVLLQTQCVTVLKFNRLLTKLDNDVGLDCNDYACLAISGGACLDCAICTLITKVDADDCTVCYTSPCGGSFAQNKTDYNTLVCELNTSTKPSFSDYPSICCSTVFEAPITCICSNNSRVTMSCSLCWLTGPATRFEGICSCIQWAPNHFGDPYITKQVREGTINFDDNNFYSAKVAYASDLSRNFEEKLFLGRGSGIFGVCCFGCQTWGGCGTQVPLRTLIPRDKQRCRYIFLKFNHFNAREDFKVIGIGLIPRKMSERGYKDI